MPWAWAVRRSVGAVRPVGRNRAYLAPGTNALNETPVPLPTTRQNPEPLPGQAESQPWVDATGSEVQ